MPRQRQRHGAIEKCGRELDRMTRHHAEVEFVEPAGAPGVPGPFLDDDVIVDAVALRPFERAVGDLVHPHRARRRSIHLEGVGSPRPAPVGPHHRVSRALHLRERREKLRADDVCRVPTKEGRIRVPRLGRRLVEHAADREEELRRLADHLMDPIDREPQRRQGHGAGSALRKGRRAPKCAQPAAAVASARPEARHAKAAPPAFSRSPSPWPCSGSSQHSDLRGHLERSARRPTRRRAS